MEHLARSVGVLTDLHLEWNVPDMVQTKRHQAAFNEAIDTERHDRVLVCSPLGERLNSSTDWRPNEGQNHTCEDSSQTRNDRNEALTRKEAKILRQFNTVEAVEHIRCNRTGDNPPENTRISKVFSCDLFSR